ncbi:MAG: radical SAM protein [Polyangiaceae bacterium]|nr:radical SAM protein [Polyangiaceae bacterium]
MSAPPPRADLKVGFACNNRCVFCAQGEKRGTSARIPMDELLSRLSSVRGTTRGLVLTGGEPTLHRQILQIVAAARRMGFAPIQIQTNGRMLSYEGVLKQLLAAGATEISPSLHGSRAEIHDGLTRAPGSFEQTVQGIRNVARAGVTLVTNTVMTRANLHDIPRIVDLLAALGVRHAQLAFVHPVGTAAERFDEVVPRLPDIVDPLRRAREIARAWGVRLVTEAVPYCFLRGMEELAVEHEIPHTTVVDLDGQSADYSTWRRAEGKAHGEPCRGCARHDGCEGPWREYVEKFGWAEMVPLSEEPRQGG